VRFSLWTAALLWACAPGLTPTPSDKDGSPADAPPEGGATGSSPSEDSAAGGDGTDDTATTGDDSARGSGAGDSGSDPAPTPVVTRFVALGDAGTGDSKQTRVAAGLANVCAQRGCDFAVYLGDNFYSDGVTSVDDSKFQSVFEEPYAALDFPFWVVLGNHDYGGNGGGWEPYRTDAQVAYTARSTKWRMPDQYWTAEEGPVSLLGLDTNALAWERAADQIAWFPGARDATAGRWRIALGHHTWLSNGPHGNAGSWDGGNGGSVFRDFFAAEVCGKVDLYLGGHDHSLQWPQSPCAGTEVVVTGAGGKTSSVGSGANQVWYETSQLGFFYVEIVGDTLTGTFYDADGNKLYERAFDRTRG
jgi:hypothetical protein